VLRDLMSRLPGRLDRDWVYVPRTPGEPAENVPGFPRSPPRAQSREVSTLAERGTIPSAYCVTWRDNHRPREAESRAEIADPEE
jgi:hypothetical protein